MEDIQCMDPDYEYEILDNCGDIDISDIPTSPTNTITESDGENFGDFCIDDLTFDEKSFQLARSYAISNKDNKIVEEEYDIDWLASESGRGRGSKLYSCKEHHLTDYSKSLELMGRWIQLMAKSESTTTQAFLIEEIFTAITNFFEKKKKRTQNLENTPSDFIQPKPLSLMTIKICLRLQKINLNTLKESCKIYEIIKENPEKADLLETQKTEFDINNILTEVKKFISMDNNFPPPNVIILEPGDNPNNTESVQNAALMYLNDVGLESTGFITLVADEAIYRRLYGLHESKEFHFLLGGWHTRKQRLFKIYKQDVEKSEQRITTGR
ncbi:7867_t:CDS:2 [Ambispora gerdemannii]|uniref:7867_t:CDS:1 n=1 Tax=Ambispora gerdemannii TaxID=144530 RepID=A0A9N9GRS3_9GLOM|nr:7867_t:CDS:2 [Ambispora gerdemannii]